MRRALAGVAALLLGFWLLPVVEGGSAPSSVALDRHGRLLGASVAPDEQWRFPPGEGPVPPRLAAAVTTFEDGRFAWHPGVDPIAIGRALWQDAVAGRVVSGGSTLTMQVVRLARGNPPRTLPEKAVEAVLALRLEAATTKDEVLATWLALAPFGGNTVGVEAAAWRWFGRAPTDLSWAEAATLAVLPNHPGLVHPGRNRDALRAKRDRLLDRLRDGGHLTALQTEAAKAEPVPEAPRPLPRDAPHLLAHAPGERVATTLDADLQRRAVEVVERHQRLLAGQGVANLAVLVAELRSGEVRAYVGNVAPGSAPGAHVDVVVAPRSTGSLLKPFLHAAMLGEGELLPDQLLPDVPTRIGGFTPENFDHTYDGAIAASAALARSRNVPAVHLLREHGVERFAAELRQLGMTTLWRPAADYGLALAVGGAEGTLWDLVGMYRDLALVAQAPGSAEATGGTAGGGLPPALTWRAGGARTPRDAVLDPGAAWLTLAALEEVERPGVDAAWRSFRDVDPVAWKTGTSHGFRDAWAIGVTPEHAIGVWVGNADGEGRPGLTGYQVAAPVLFDLVDLVPSHGRFERPDRFLVDVEVCAHSGRLAGPDCGERVHASVPRAGARGPVCGSCTQVWCAADDPACAHRVHAGCEAQDRMVARPWFVLPPAQAGFYAAQHPEHRALPPWRDDCRQGADEAQAMAVLQPAPGADVFVPVELDGRQGRVVFEASHRDPRAAVHWHLDDGYVATTEGPHQLAVAPAPGEHRLTLVDDQGGRVERRFRVVAR